VTELAFGIKLSLVQILRMTSRVDLLEEFKRANMECIYVTILRIAGLNLLQLEIHPLLIGLDHQPVSRKSQGGYWDEYKMLIKNVDFPMFDRTVSPKDSFDGTTHSVDH